MKEEFIEVSKALLDAVDSCTTTKEVEAVMREFPFTGVHDEDTAMLTAALFMAGMKFMIKVLAFEVKQNELRKTGSHVCPN